MTTTETVHLTARCDLSLAGLSAEEALSELARLDIWTEKERGEIKRVEEDPTFIKLGNLLMDVIQPATRRSEEIADLFKLLITRWMEMRPGRYKSLDVREVLKVFAEVRARSSSVARSIASLGMPAPTRSVDYEGAISTVATAAATVAGEMDAAALEAGEKTSALYDQYNKVARAYNALRAKGLDLDEKRKEDTRYYNQLCEKGNAV